MVSLIAVSVGAMNTSRIPFSSAPIGFQRLTSHHPAHLVEIALCSLTKLQVMNMELGSFAYNDGINGDTLSGSRCGSIGRSGMWIRILRKMKRVMLMNPRS